MSLADWVKNGWLESHKSSREEIQNLLGIVERDLRDCRAQGVSSDWRFAIAYNAALQAATAALAAAGYRPPGTATTTASFNRSNSRLRKTRSSFAASMRSARNET
jgi:hypothetical protein